MNETDREEWPENDAPTRDIHTPPALLCIGTLFPEKLIQSALFIDSNYPLLTRAPEAGA